MQIPGILSEWELKNKNSENKRMRVVCTWQVRQRRMLVFFPRTAHDVHEASCGLRCPSVGRKFGSGASRAIKLSFFVSLFFLVVCAVWLLIVPYVCLILPSNFISQATIIRRCATLLQLRPQCDIRETGCINPQFFF